MACAGAVTLPEDTGFFTYNLADAMAFSGQWGITLAPAGSTFMANRDGDASIRKLVHTSAG